MVEERNGVLEKGVVYFVCEVVLYVFVLSLNFVLFVGLICFWEVL